MKEKSNLWLAIALMAAFALTRIPGLLPPNFSAAYALAFCAGVYFPPRMAWWLPLGALFCTDLALNIYYSVANQLNAFQVYQMVNYLVYAVIIWIGRRLSHKASWIKLVSGGVLGALLFYLITNTAAWLFNPFGNPEYTKTLAGWIIALTKGTAGYASTWEFFQRTLLSGGLFTALFVGAMKLTEASETEREAPEQPAEQPEEDAASEPTPKHEPQAS